MPPHGTTSIRGHQNHQNYGDSMIKRTPKNLLFSVTKKDFDFTYFKVGGNGGQRADKTDSACRIRHRASGITAECRDFRTQGENKKHAFIKLTQSPAFQLWLKTESARALGHEIAVEKKVDEMMDPKNLKLEVHDENGRWIDG